MGNRASHSVIVYYGLRPAGVTRATQCASLRSHLRAQVVINQASGSSPASQGEPGQAVQARAHRIVACESLRGRPDRRGAPVYEGSYPLPALDLPFVRSTSRGCRPVGLLSGMRRGEGLFLLVLDGETIHSPVQSGHMRSTAAALRSLRWVHPQECCVANRGVLQSNSV